MELFEQVVLACKALQNKKSQDVVVMDVAKVSTITSYIVLATATSNVHARALLNNVDEELDKQNIQPLHKEGYGQSDWVVLDYGDFIVHIFTKQLREYYNLEKLYQDGKNLRRIETILKDMLEKEKKVKKKTLQIEKQKQKEQDKINQDQVKKENKETKKQAKQIKNEKANQSKTASSTKTKTDKKVVTKPKQEKSKKDADNKKPEKAKKPVQKKK